MFSCCCQINYHYHYHRVRKFKNITHDKSGIRLEWEQCGPDKINPMISWMEENCIGHSDPTAKWEQLEEDDDKYEKEDDKFVSVKNSVLIVISCVCASNPLVFVSHCILHFVVTYCEKANQHSLFY